MPSSLLDKIKAMKIEDFKLNKLNQQSMGGLGRAVELTLKFIQVIYCEYKVDGSQRLSYVSTVRSVNNNNNIAEWTISPGASTFSNVGVIV